VSFLSRALSSILDILAPPACLACDATAEGKPFCPACWAPLTLSKPARLDCAPLVVLGAYRPPLSTAIVRFKYQGRAELSRPLARMLAPALDEAALGSGAALVPVPLHPQRLASRGYNQAALLAQDLAALRQRDCHPRLLRRVRETERQVGKSLSERHENPDGAFELRRAGPTRVVLVDDVVTTGSTVRACAQALAAGGIELSAVVALAHAEQP
jgi:ComF family protein